MISREFPVLVVVVVIIDPAITTIDPMHEMNGDHTFVLVVRGGLGEENSTTPRPITDYPICLRQSTAPGVWSTFL